MRFRHTDPQGNGLSRRNSEGLRVVPSKGLGGQKECTGISPRKDWVINSAFHTQIVGLGKAWQCEGWNHSNFFSFWRHPVGEMSYVLMKCHPSIRGLSSASVSVFSTVLGTMGGGTGGDVAPDLRKLTFYWYSRTYLLKEPCWEPCFLGFKFPCGGSQSRVTLSISFPPWNSLLLRGGAT